jgi:hypothetical protein
MNFKFTKETARRALRTFLQAFLSYIAVNIVAINFTDDKDIVKSGLIGLCVSAVAAGVAAIMNLERPQDYNENETSDEELEDLDDEEDDSDDE